MIIGQPHTIIRRKPVNLRETDAYIFNEVFSYEVPAPDILQLKDAQILKEMVFDPKRRTFAGAYTHLRPVPLGRRLKRLLWLMKPAQRIDQGIWTTHEWGAEYFHWFTDVLCRLMIVPDDYIGFPLLLPDFYESRPYIRESLAILGIQAWFYPIRKRLQVHHLVLPGHVALTGNYNESVIRGLRDRFLKDHTGTAKPFRKVYVSRGGASRRKVLNEAGLTSLLTAFGYEIHHFEHYSLAKQISLMLETKVLAGPHGAGLTNMLFMPPGGLVLELRNNTDILNNCFFALSSALYHSYFYLLSSGGDANGTDITVGTDELQQTLQEIEALAG